MLKYRLLTAFLMGPLILWAIYVMPENLFALFSFVIVTIGAWEWGAFAGWVKPLQRGLFFTVNVLLFITVLLLQNAELNLAIILASLLWWLICIPLLLFFPFQKNNPLHTQAIKSVIGIVLLLGTLVSMVMIRILNMVLNLFYI